MFKSILTILVVLYLTLPSFTESAHPSWIRRHDGVQHDKDEAEAIAIDDSGYVYVTGRIGFNDGRCGTIKYNPEGDTVWVRLYPESRSWGHDVAVDDSGYVYVVGDILTSETKENLCLTIKYRSNGDMVWARTFVGDGHIAHGHAIAVDASGYVYVTGYYAGMWGYWDFLTIKYYPNGDTAWIRWYDPMYIGGRWDDRAQDLIVDGSGCVYVTGSSETASLSYAVTIKYDSDGDTAWVRRQQWPEGSNAKTSAIAVDDVGNVYVTGATLRGDEYNDYLTVKYSPEGDTSWVRVYPGPSHGDDEACDIAIDGSGNAYVTGRMDEDYGTIKYYSNGDTAWVRTYGSPYLIEEASAVAIDIQGNVYVTGRSENTSDPPDYDYATVVYDQNGNWTSLAVYGGPASLHGDDEARDIAADKSGNFYVTGKSVGIGTLHDYLTIKHTQVTSLISITDDAFVPRVDTAMVGETVRWTNNGGELHTVTSDTKSSWDSGPLNPGESFTHQFLIDGVYPYHCEFNPTMTGTIVVQSGSSVNDETGSREKPSEFSLSQNYPNPFNSFTKIEFSLVKSCFVHLEVFDILGRKVKTLVSETLSPGYKSVFWDGKNEEGEEASSGLYMYRISTGGFAESKKMLMLK